MVALLMLVAPHSDPDFQLWIITKKTRNSHSNRSPEPFSAPRFPVIQGPRFAPSIPRYRTHVHTRTHTNVPYVIYGIHYSTHDHFVPGRMIASLREAHPSLTLLLDKAPTLAFASPSDHPPVNNDSQHCFGTICPWPTATDATP